MLIGDYLVIQDFTTAGGGRGEWSFARKGGKVYFIKRFLSPKPVTPGQLGSARTRERQRRRCAAFEARHNRILAALAGQVGEGGNLIAPLDFFQFEGSYYKVTERIESRGVTAESVSGLPPGVQLIILRSAANSLAILHAAGIVHGDIKADNVLIRARAGGLMTASLIDFDDSYFAAEPPVPPEEFVFDPPYAAPEAFLYVLDPDPEKARALTPAADIFGLGVLFHEYLTGAKPRIAGAESAYPGEALLQGGALEVAARAPWAELNPVLTAMLDRAPDRRPRIDDVKEALRAVAIAPATAATPEPAGARLRVNLGTAKTAPAPPARQANPAPKLRGTLAPRRPGGDSSEG